MVAKETLGFFGWLESHLVQGSNEAQDEYCSKLYSKCVPCSYMYSVTDRFGGLRSRTSSISGDNYSDNNSCPLNSYQNPQRPGGQTGWSM